MEFIDIIESVGKEKLQEDFQKWQENHSDVTITRINNCAIHVKTGVYPGDIKHFIYIYYKEKRKATLIGEQLLP